MDGVGFTPESAKRIGDAVKGWEAFQPSTGAGGFQRRDASKIIRVKLDDDISATDPVSGKMQRRKADFSDWEDTAITINNIYAIDSDHATAVAGDYIWVINQGNHWCEVQTDSGSSGTGSVSGTGAIASGGCCSAAVSASSLTKHGRRYAETYLVSGIPSSLIPVSGAKLYWISGYTWESDTVDFDCVDSDGNPATTTCYWRLASSMDGHGHGSTTLELILDSGSDDCGIVTGSPQYENIWDWRSRAGNTFWMQSPQSQNEPLEKILPCSVCVYPEGLGNATAWTCWQSYIDNYMPDRSLTDFPPNLSCDISLVAQTQDGIGRDVVVNYPETSFILKYDSGDSTYKTTEAISWVFIAGGGATYWNLDELEIVFGCGMNFCATFADTTRVLTPPMHGPPYNFPMVGPGHSYSAPPCSVTACADMSSANAVAKVGDKIDVTIQTKIASQDCFGAQYFGYWEVRVYEA